MQKFDLGIIGGGPAGYTAALHARAKGLSVVMFERDKAGGVCLNRGCIPTKAILHSAELYEDMKCAVNSGIIAENISFDYEKVVERKDTIVEKLRKSLELALKNAGVITISAKAELIDKNHISADYEKYECEKVIVAAGSEPKSLKGINFDNKFILNSDDVISKKELPKSIIIIGSGAIGIEWARIFSAFDTDVTIVEAAQHLLPAADIEVSKRIERIFKSKKIRMYLSDGVQKAENNKVYLMSGAVLEADCVLMAVGRKPCEIEKIEGVTYIGDISGSIQLAHYAIKQALNEVLGINYDRNLIPSVVYGNPEVAWIGKREQDLEEGSYKKANLLVSAIGKSHCDSATEGFIKILSQNNKIVGAHIISKEASSLIQQILIAIQNKVSVEKLKEVCFAHPTYSEGIFECLFKL